MAGLIQKFLSLFIAKKRADNSSNEAQRAKIMNKIASFPKISEWYLDTYHSKVEFSVMHMELVEVKGNFKKFDGQITGTSPDFSDLKVKINIDVSSVNTDSDARDFHLRSPEFFDAEKYPTITFESTKIEWKPLKYFIMHGNLTIKGITKPVQLEGELKSMINKDMFGQPKISFIVSGKINRTDWNLTWNMSLEEGVIVVDEFVELRASVEIATKQTLLGMQDMLSKMQG